MNIWTIILFFIIFGIVVISHEMGHFLLAKAGGIHVVEFSVGMGPTLCSFQKGDTKYSLKLLPIGGACMFEGEDGLNTKEGEESPGAFYNANVWKRISTVAAGPIFNFILGFLIALAMVNMIVIRDPVATQVMQGSAAEAAGLQDGDRIVSLNGERIYLYEELLIFNALYRGGDVELVYERDGQRYTTTIVPQYDEQYGRYMFGFSNGDFVELEGLDPLRYAWYEMRYNVKNTYKSLGMLLTGKVGRKDIAGPVGIANMVGQTYEQARAYGWKDVLVNMMNITLLLTVNLGIINLLPIPALDGGRLVFLLVEVIRGKPVPPEKEGMVHFIGLMFFMILMVIIFFNDIANVFGI
ncbi:MAG: RIP metalloprotease RseP [Lachnospiraceae bacterium]|nr:RIP metalloprotease RseP [Lachnospiraceae bacterium]